MTSVIWIRKRKRKRRKRKKKKKKKKKETWLKREISLKLANTQAHSYRSNAWPLASNPRRVRPPPKKKTSKRVKKRAHQKKS
jgi:hypothetical protein